MNDVGAQQLPAGWTNSTLGDVQLDLAAGVDPARTPAAMFELYSVPSHEDGAPEIVLGGAIGSNKQTITPGTVLLCKINPRINRVWVTGCYSKHPKVASTEWIPFFPLSQIEPRYLAYFLRQNSVRDFLAGNASGVGGSLMRVQPAVFRDFTFKLAPVAEQSRIADALDELLSDLEAGVAALERTRAKLKLYRASVLKAAVEGTLTANWRAQHPHTEPATEPLRRIRIERRRRWEEDQVARFKAKNQAPPKNWRARYQEPEAADMANLPSLAKEWCWISLETLIIEGPQNGLYLPSTLYGRGVPIVQIDDFQNGWIRPIESLNRVEVGAEAGIIYGLRRNDLVVNRVNSMTHLGKCFVVGEHHVGSLFRVKYDAVYTCD